MIHKSIKDISINDFQNLIENSVMENRTLEYKQELKISSDGDKKEFLADISALSNTLGGQIIFGMKEDNGIPIELVGIPIKDLDRAVLAIENLFRDGIEPRIMGIEIYPIVPIDDNNGMLLIKVPRSWNSPHRVIIKGHNDFYGRNAGGKYKFDVTELRQAFNLSSMHSKELNDFRKERISTIINQKLPLPNNYSEKLVIHLIPLNSLHGGQQIDIDKLKADKALLQPFGARGWEYKYNFDGYISFYNEGTENQSYNQYFKNGIIEITSGEIVRNIEFRGNHIKSLDGELFIKNTLECLAHNFELIEKLEISYPLFVCFTLYNCIDAHISWNNDRQRDRKIDRVQMFIPELMLEHKPETLQETIKPILNSIWNSAGYEMCPIYKQ